MGFLRKSNSWPITTLGKLFKIKHGYAFKGEFFSTVGQYILLTPGNFLPDGGIKLKGEKEKYYIGQFPKEFLLSKGDLLIVMTDLTQAATILGSPAFIPKNNLFLHNQRLGKIYNISSSVDVRFLYFLLNTSYVREQIKGSATGATVRHTAPERIYKVKAALPPLPIQRKIAAILSAYDDLIENNLRRIKILEEMAQNLYREWFVNFRFPGHENTRFVDSPLGKIPEGCEVSMLGDHLSTLESGKRPKGGIQGNCKGIPSVGAENVRKIGRHNYQSEKYIPKSFYEEMKKGKVKHGDVALYKDGAYIGRSTYFRDNFPHPKFCVNEHVFILRSNGNKLTQNILYLWLQESSTIAYIRSTNANAAQPGINQKGVRGLKIIIASKEIANDFDELVEPLLALIISLAKKNNILRQTRDLLLPKLISGEVDVSELDIKVPEEAVS